MVPRRARRLLIVTAVGASATSRIFYNRVKGEVEDAIAALGFPGGTTILRPSMLLGEREESRPGERVAASVMKAARGLFAGGLKRYRPIDASDVARAMWQAAREGRGASSTQVLEGEPLFELARRSHGA